MKKENPIYRTGIGQDSHRFLPEDTMKPCILGGIMFDDMPGFKANSDGDVIFHAICNAISSLTGVIILGEKADVLLKKDGITDSQVYVEEALKTLKNQQIAHVALSLEGTRPRLLHMIAKVRKNIAKVLKVKVSQVGITATSGEGLTDFGCGEGVQCFCILTTVENL
ncbi:MAG: 2-C-methyl-D-erythritol 2,4-cyclodiphosphate synthase [Chlamydiales bacterium]